MPSYYASLSDDLADWAVKQPLFFIASAGTKGKHVNISPKGYPADTLSVIHPNQVAYLDYTGSGSETIAHVYENRRATIMFCSFGPSPRILRLFCTGRVVEAEEAEFPEWLHRMKKTQPTGVRAVIVFDVWKVQTSCGYGVPQLESPNVRRTLQDWNAKQAKSDKMGEYQIKNNSRSLDDLPGLRSARRRKGEWMLIGDAVAFLRRNEDLLFGMLIGFIICFLTSNPRFIDALRGNLPSSINIR